MMSISADSITTVASVTSTTSVTSPIVSLAQSLVQLHESIGRLTSSLQPILRPSTDKVDTNADVPTLESADSQLLNQLNALVAEVDQATARISSLEMRSQL